MADGVHFDSLLEVSEKIRRGRLSSLDVTEALLARIERFDGALDSSALVLSDSAREQARSADEEISRGRWRGPLHGVPIGIKDLLWTKGLPTMAGLEVLRDFRPQEDATVVDRLKQAGAVLIAKHNLTEGATITHHPAFPHPVNPWSPGHWPGVSSSGSGVATAAGFCFGSIGSDTGGSIRLPSAANNLTGIKPTWGRVSRHGIVHLSESLDHLGPLARTAGDAAAVLQAIAGLDPRDPTSLPDPVPDYVAMMDGGVTGLRLGMDWDFAAGGMPSEIVAALERAVDVLEDRGMDICDISFPWLEETAALTGAIFMAEIAIAHEEHFHRHADKYDVWLRGVLERQGGAGGFDVARAHMERDRFRGRMRTLFGEVDLVLMPGLGGLLPGRDAAEAMGRGEAEFDFALFRHTMPFNMSGTPTISLPGGFSADGLPIGIQLGGAWLAEPALVRAGVAFQQETDFHERHPDLEALEAA
jgi:amidase